jgi:hypothetical protein
MVPERTRLDLGSACKNYPDLGNLEVARIGPIPRLDVFWKVALFRADGECSGCR